VPVIVSAEDVRDEDMPWSIVPGEEETIGSTSWGLTTTVPALDITDSPVLSVT
jgi:hypothetical protein